MAAHTGQIVTFDDDGEGGEVRLDLNAPDLTTVAALKVYFGFNLDNFQASKVTLTGEGGKEVVVEGTADGKTVRIEVQGDQVKVEVDGKHTFPK